MCERRACEGGSVSRGRHRRGSSRCESSTPFDAGTVRCDAGCDTGNGSLRCEFDSRGQRRLTRLVADVADDAGALGPRVDARLERVGHAPRREVAERRLLGQLERRVVAGLARQDRAEQQLGARERVVREAVVPRGPRRARAVDRVDQLVGHRWDEVLLERDLRWRGGRGACERHIAAAWGRRPRVAARAAPRHFRAVELPIRARGIIKKGRGQRARERSRAGATRERRKPSAPWSPWRQQ